jgi:hypothetical protein
MACVCDLIVCDPEASRRGGIGLSWADTSQKRVVLLVVGLDAVVIV